MQIQRLVDLEDYEFDTLLVTYNHKNRLSIELGKVSEIFESLQADGLVGGSKVYGLRGKDFSYQGQPYYNLIFIGIPEKATPRRFQLQFGQAMKEATKKTPQWVHFGAGNIFRAFPAALQQKLLNEGIEKTGTSPRRLLF